MQLFGRTACDTKKKLEKPIWTYICNNFSRLTVGKRESRSSGQTNNTPDVCMFFSILCRNVFTCKLKPKKS